MVSVKRWMNAIGYTYDVVAYYAAREFETSSVRLTEHDLINEQMTTFRVNVIAELKAWKSD